MRDNQGLRVNGVAPPDEPLESFKPSRSLKDIGYVRVCDDISAVKYIRPRRSRSSIKIKNKIKEKRKVFCSGNVILNQYGYQHLVCSMPVSNQLL